MFELVNLVTTRILFCFPLEFNNINMSYGTTINFTVCVLERETETAEAMESQGARIIMKDFNSVFMGLALLWKG